MSLMLIYNVLGGPYHIVHHIAHHIALSELRKVPSYLMAASNMRCFFLCLCTIFAVVIVHVISTVLDIMAKAPRAGLQR